MEYWDIYDRWGNPTGRCVKKGEPLQEDEFHLAAELWLLDDRSRILVQQRSEDCEILPGIWGLTTGRMQAGEDTRTGCVREAREELGLLLSPAELKWRYRVARTDGTHLIWDIYTARCNRPESDFQLQSAEVSQVKWVDRAEFEGMLEQGVMFHYPEIEEILDMALSQEDRGDPGHGA